MRMTPQRLVCLFAPQIPGPTPRIALEYACLGVPTTPSAKIPQGNAWRDATIGAHLLITPPLSALKPALKTHLPITAQCAVLLFALLEPSLITQPGNAFLDALKTLLFTEISTLRFVL